MYRIACYVAFLASCASEPAATSEPSQRLAQSKAVATVIAPTVANEPVAGKGVKNTPEQGATSIDIRAEVPAFSTNHVSRAKAKQAKKLNARGVKLHRAKTFDLSIPKFIEALTIDPSHLLARYNLSCSYALAGQSKKALAVLADFKRADCPECIGRLVKATTDTDWKSLWGDPSFGALTKGAVELAPLVEGGTEPGPVANSNGSHNATEVDSPPGNDFRIAPSALGTDDSDARKLCKDEEYEGDCSFRAGGHLLPGGGRADILLIRDQSGDVEASLAIRPPTTDLDTVLEQVGFERDEAGTSTAYSITRFEVTADSIRLSVTSTYTEYPCTGDDEDDESGPECQPRVETSKSTHICTKQPEWEFKCAESP
ncbi:MAG: hypothetical protein JKY56_16175 [Kofleriaceae bacterium]|nr:hypothetical protein [Kofleriaceae bacterium]